MASVTEDPDPDLDTLHCSSKSQNQASAANDSGIEEPCPDKGSSRSRSSSEGDPSMSYLETSGVSSSSSHCNYISAHIVPRNATAVFSAQTLLTYLPLRILLHENCASKLIGENQQMIRWIGEKSGTSIAVMEKQFHVRGNNWFDKMVILFGTNESYRVALKHILEILSEDGGGGVLVKQVSNFSKSGETNSEDSDELVDDDGQAIYLRIVAFNSITGRLIGRLGKNLKDVMFATNTKITVTSTPYTWNETRTDSDRIVLIVGKPDNVLEACCKIITRISNAFTVEYKSTGQMPGEAMPQQWLPSMGMGCIQHQPQFQNMASCYFPSNSCAQHGHLPQTSGGSIAIPVPIPTQGPQSSLGLCNAYNQNHAPVMMNLVPSTSMPIMHPMSAGGADSYNANAFQQKPLPVEKWDRNKVMKSIVYCPANVMSSVIGPKGSNLRYIRDMTDVVVEVNNMETFKPLNRSRSQSFSERKDLEYDKQLILTGIFTSHLRALLIIFNLVYKYYCSKSMTLTLDEDDEKENEEDPKCLEQPQTQPDIEVKLTVEFNIPTKFVPRIIGSKGNKLQAIQESTSTYIQFGTQGYGRGSKHINITATESKVKICGTFNGIRSAQAKIFNIVDSLASAEEKEMDNTNKQMQMQTRPQFLQHYQQQVPIPATPIRYTPDPCSMTMMPTPQQQLSSGPSCMPSMYPYQYHPPEPMTMYGGHGQRQ